MFEKLHSPLSSSILLFSSLNSYLIQKQEITDITKSLKALTVCMKTSGDALFDHITQQVETNFPRNKSCLLIEIVYIMCI